mgnify:FL=1
MAWILGSVFPGRKMCFIQFFHPDCGGLCMIQIFIFLHDPFGWAMIGHVVRHPQDDKPHIVGRTSALHYRVASITHYDYFATM